jgi:hypothetical protein
MPDINFILASVGEAGSEPLTLLAKLLRCLAEGLGAGSMLLILLNNPTLFARIKNEDPKRPHSFLNAVAGTVWAGAWMADGWVTNSAARRAEAPSEGR